MKLRGHSPWRARVAATLGWAGSVGLVCAEDLATFDSLRLGGQTYTQARVDQYPAIAKGSRKPFVEKRREVYLKLGRRNEADADERDLKSAARN